MTYVSTTSGDGPGTAGIMLITIGLAAIAGVSFLFAIVPSIIYWLLWIVSLFGGLALLIFSLWDTVKNHHILSFPVGIACLGYAVVAGPLYRFLFCYSGEFTYHRSTNVGSFDFQGKQTYIYPALIAFVTIVIAAAVFILGKQLKALPHLALEIGIVAVLTASLLVPSEMVINRMSAVLCQLQQASLHVQKYVVVATTDLYVGTDVFEDKLMSVSEETVFFPGSPLISRLAVRSLPVGAMVLSDGTKRGGWSWKGIYEGDLLAVSADDGTFGYVWEQDIQVAG